MNKTLLTIIALLLLAAGAGLGYWAYDTASQPGYELLKALDESRRNKVVAAYSGAGACIAIGLYLLLVRRK
ncbi:MAG TPA: DUF3185 family protein [Pseudomonadales bacterium]